VGDRVHVDTGAGGDARIGMVSPNNSHETRYFQGVIDELTVYGKALTQADIQAIYNSKSAGKAP